MSLIAIKNSSWGIGVLAEIVFVYKISCHDCETSYVEQTKRQLRIRINEHISDVRKKNGSPSVISEHRINHNHNLEWDNVRIIDNEPSYRKRLISEMIYIKATAGIE